MKPLFHLLILDLARGLILNNIRDAASIKYTTVIYTGKNHSFNIRSDCLSYGTPLTRHAMHVYDLKLLLLHHIHISCKYQYNRICITVIIVARVIRMCSYMSMTWGRIIFPVCDVFLCDTDYCLTQVTLASKCARTVAVCNVNEEHHQISLLWVDK